MAKLVENPNVVIFGDVCIDSNTTEQGATYTGWGGPGLYAQLAAQSLGINEVTTISTYGNDFRPYSSGFSLMPPPQLSIQTLTYKNVTTETGRIQTCQNPNTAVLPKMTDEIRKIIRGADIIMVAPLTPNYNTKQIESIRDLAEPRNSLMVLCPQGYFRDIQPDGSIIPRPFRESNLLLPHFELAMLSEADTPNAARTAQSWALHSLRTRIIVTKAADGAEIIRAHGDHMQIPTTPIDPNCIVDSVGCGDFFAMATAIAYWRNRGNLYKAIAEGHVAAAKKLTGIFAAT